MYLSLSWLNDHVDLSGLDPERIAHDLTMRTALIEGVVDQAAALEGVVVGKVLECGPHPGADRLSVCTVDGGGGRTAHVVCGAPNVAAGQTIVYAPVGTRLPNGLKLKKAKIRGEPSEGMICAEDEIGIGPEHDGILVLDGHFEPGAPIGTVPGLTDVLFEIDNKSVTHRPDLWGHYGFARELAVIYGRELKPLALDEALGTGDVGPPIDLEFDGCPLYAGLCIDDEPTRSPDWLRFRLVGCGMRPLNLLVDLSNYVMLETGQPTHPFDRDRLAGDRIVVRAAGEGEVLRTLDGEDRRLVPGDMVVADGEQAVALAGIMGGETSEVSDSTRRVFLESASFDAKVVRRTSSRLGLRSEALARFEKALDPSLVETALRRYAHLLGELRPEAEVASCYRAAGAAEAPARQVRVRGERVRALLGTDVPEERMVELLDGLGFGVETLDGELRVDVPSWRATRDITLPEDVIEEVGRVLGYESIPDRPPVGTLRTARRDALLEIEDDVRDSLARDAAYTESLTYSTIRDATLQAMGLDGDVQRPRLRNALQADAATLRPSVVPEMVMGLEAWLRHAEDVRRFEVGRGYSLEDGQIRERREVAVLRACRAARDGRELVRELRGVAQTVLAALDRPAPAIERWTPAADTPWWHPSRSARLCCDGREVARLGALAPEVLVGLGLEGSAAVLVFDVEALAALDEGARAFEAIGRQPPAHLDLAFVIDYGTTADQVADAIRQAGPKTLRRVEAFDVYRGAPLGADERSVAFHLTFQAADRTLKDSEVQKARDRIVSAVEKIGARLR